MRIDKVVAQFEVWPGETLPFAKFKVKVLERSPTDYLAVTNVTALNHASREPEYISGLGDSAEEAVEDLLIRFMAGIREQVPAAGLSETDFVWSSYVDF